MTSEMWNDQMTKFGGRRVRAYTNHQFHRDGLVGVPADLN